MNREITVFCCQAQEYYQRKGIAYLTTQNIRGCQILGQEIAAMIQSFIRAQEGPVCEEVARYVPCRRVGVAHHARYRLAVGEVPACRPDVAARGHCDYCRSFAL